MAFMLRHYIADISLCLRAADAFFQRHAAAADTPLIIFRLFRLFRRHFILHIFARCHY
jgi:hypothetical protein